MNKDDKDLLGGICKLCETGMQAAETVIPKTSDPCLRKELEEQYSDYSKASAETRQALMKAGITPEKPGLISKGVMWGSIQLHTLTDTSPDHIAEIMLNGTNMGIIDLTRHISSCTSANKDTLRYAKDFLAGEERHADNLKAFL